MSDNVYVCFGRWDNLISRLIRWATKGEWSHCWIEYDSKRWGARMAVHSDRKGVIVEPMTNFIERRGQPLAKAIYKVSNREIDGHKPDLDLGFMRSRHYLGKDYGYFAVISNLIILTLWRAGWKSLEGVQDVGKYVCSEFCALFIKNSEIPTNLDPELTWPSKLSNWMNKRPKRFPKEL